MLAPLVGNWRGTSTGTFGTAEVSRRARFVLGGRFLEVTTTSKSATEVHEDIGIYSYDRGRETVVLREFHNEGYINQHKATVIHNGRIVLESEHIENPYDPTLRARLILELGEPTREVVELTTGNKPFAPCVDIELRRVG